MPERVKITSKTDLETVPKTWVRCKLHQDVLDRLDELRAMTGQTRADAIADAIGWMLARESESLRRWQIAERERLWREQDAAERKRLARERHPERFDQEPAIEETDS